jgi:hypothetical protein
VRSGAVCAPPEGLPKAIQIPWRQAIQIPSWPRDSTWDSCPTRCCLKVTYYRVVQMTTVGDDLLCIFNGLENQTKAPTVGTTVSPRFG